MHLKRLNPHARAGVVQLPGAIQAANAREVFETDIFAGQVGGGGVGDVGDRVDGGAAHGAFEAGVGVRAVELGEGLEEPGGWRGLGCVSEIREMGRDAGYLVGRG